MDWEEATYLSIPVSQRGSDQRRRGRAFGELDGTVIYTAFVQNDTDANLSSLQVEYNATIIDTLITDFLNELSPFTASGITALPNWTFKRDVIIEGTLFGGSPLTIGSDVNMTTGTIYLNEFSTSSAGGSLVVRRSNAEGALFGVENTIAGANPTSGAGYITIQDCGNYTVDAHSSLDVNNPSDVVHHIRGCLENEYWRLNPDFSNSSFEFESSLGITTLKINRTAVSVIGVNLLAVNATINDFMRLVANTSAITCNAGTIYYDDTLRTHMGCNGTWERMY